MRIILIIPFKYVFAFLKANAEVCLGDSFFAAAGARWLAEMRCENCFHYHYNFLSAHRVGKIVIYASRPLQ